MLSFVNSQDFRQMSQFSLIHCAIYSDAMHVCRPISFSASFRVMAYLLAGIILCVRSVDEIRRYTLSLAGRIHRTIPLLDAEPLPELMLSYCQLDPCGPISVNFVWNSKVFIKENEFQNVVCKLAVILLRPRYFNSPPTPLDKMAVISQTIFSDAFSWMKIFDFD